MVSVPSLWLPILLAAVLVFVISSVIHMVLKYHRTDFKQVPKEDGVMDALRPFGIPPGEYVVPFAGDPAVMKTPEFKAKVDQGPVLFMTVMPSGQMGMGSQLVQWFVYCIVVGIFAAYVAGRALGPGADYWPVFRFAGTAAFLGYAMALVQNSIWYKRAWSTTLKSVFDGFIYAMLTAGALAGFWPR